MLSPPSSRWSPTASRVSARLPPSSPTSISVKSVVPPPTSATSTRSPTLDLLPPVVAGAVEPGVERGLRLFQQREVLEARRRGPPRRSVRARRRRTTPAPSARCPALRAGSRRRPWPIAWFHASARCFRYRVLGLERRDLAAGVRRPVRQDRRPCDRRPDGTATTWRRRRAASAPASRSCGRTRRRSNRASASHGSFSAPAGCSPGRRADTGTTAEAADPRPRPARRPAESGTA